jgi:hypothetical protein
MVSVRRVAPVLLLVMATAAFAAKPKQSSHPPRSLHRAGDHYTAYTAPDPATYPPTAKTYTVKRGDSLWALAQNFYGNAYLWPQLWETNTWITDAHWIYPGDVLLVEGETAQTSSASASGTTTLSSGSTAADSDQATTTTTGGGGTGALTADMAPAGSSGPVALGFDADLYCYGYIGDPKEPMPNRINHFEDTEITYLKGALEQIEAALPGDFVYLDGGTSTGLVAGETYMVVQPGIMVNKPGSIRVLVGQEYEFRGQIRVLCADESHARGVITQACGEILAGARLKPMPQLPIPIVRVPDMPGFCDGPSNKADGFIVTAKDGEQALAIGTLVQVNLGKENQIQPGDFLTVFRESPIDGQPRQMLGEIGVLTTENSTATGKIVLMRRAMIIGDRVEIK